MIEIRSIFFIGDKYAYITMKTYEFDDKVGISLFKSSLEWINKSLINLT